MSTSYLKPALKAALMGRAGGRCQYRGCNKPLDMDELTSRRLNKSVYAHIIADSEDGPRGDPVLSPQLGQDIQNLMVLCHDHHRLIDHEGLNDHPVELLRAMKREHEERVANLLDIQEDHRTRLLFVQVNIGQYSPQISLESAREAVLPRYPVVPEILVDLTRQAIRDDEPDFWARSADEIKRQVEQRLAPTLADPGYRSLSLFALAPIPLLMWLGRVLGDLNSCSVFQKLRAPDSWTWEGDPGPAGSFTLETPQAEELVESGHVSLLLSVSGVVTPQEVAATFEEPLPTWHIRAENPGLDGLRSLAQLEAFVDAYRDALQQIRSIHGPNVVVHVLPAVPNSVAVECGRRLLPKADPSLVAYDKNKTGVSFSQALTILEAPEGAE